MANFAEVLRKVEQERSRLDQAIQAIGELVGRNHTGAIQKRAKRRRRTVSVAARRKMAAAQRARWAKAKRGEASTAGAQRAKLHGRRLLQPSELARLK
jgi:hypothetical protein